MSRNQNSEWPLIKQGRLHVRNSHLLKGREATEITLTAYKIEKKIPGRRSDAPTECT